MPSIHDLMPSKYLKQADVPSPIIRTIDHLEPNVELGQGADADVKSVLFFQEPDTKPMVMNVGSLLTLGQIDEDYTLWNGVRIEIYVDPNVMFAGKRTGGLRLRIPANAPPRTATASAPASNTLSFNEAIAEAEKVGITKDALIEKLKAAGRSGYNAERDTAMVRELLKADVPF